MNFYQANLCTFGFSEFFLNLNFLLKQQICRKLIQLFTQSAFEAHNV